jgi:hypothetical protein
MKNLNLTLCLVIATMIGISGASYSQMAGQPANSYVSGSKWYCSAGYLKSGNKCVSIFAGMAGQPANSYVSGSKWYCSAGYSKSGNKCVSIFAGMAGQPANSYVSGSKWYCSAGYSKSGNKCVSIFAGMAGQTAESAVNKRRVDQGLEKEQQKKDLQLAEQRRRDKKEIAGIQRQLIGHKYLRGSADGIPGNKTSTAVKAFYRDAGITRPALDDYTSIAADLSWKLLSPAGNCPDGLTRSSGFSVCFTVNGQD